MEEDSRATFCIGVRETVKVFVYKSVYIQLSVEVFNYFQNGKRNSEGVDECAE